MSAGDGIVIEAIDHLVLTVADIERTVAFYARTLGMRRVDFGQGRVALAFGGQKINLHQLGREFEPKASRPAAGSADFCLITKTPIATVVRALQAAGVAIEAGPVPKTGAKSQLNSVYIRDPDGNLVEIANEVA